MLCHRRISCDAPDPLTLDRLLRCFDDIYGSVTAVIVCTVIIRSILRMPGRFRCTCCSHSRACRRRGGYNYRHVHTEEPICTLDGKRCTVIAEVEQRLYFREYGAAYSVRLISADGRDISGRATFRADYPADLDTGERFRADVTVGRYLDGNASVSEVWYSLSDDMLFVLESADGSHDAFPEICDGFSPALLLCAFFSPGLDRNVGSGDYGVPACRLTCDEARRAIRVGIFPSRYSHIPCVERLI